MSTVQDSSPQPQVNSPWSIKIATAAGIPIRLHFTFLLFMLWIGFGGWQAGSWAILILVATLFTCVVLHELGHAFTALHFGIKTRDITLYPIGGIAMLQGKPTAKQELWIALAGPMVNFVIALALLPIGLAATHGHIIVQSLAGDGWFVRTVMQANFILGAFNLAPAFPMDGGRVLRAALALRMPEVKATQIAASLGQSIAICFGLVAILWMHDPIWMLIAFFVFLGAGQEASSSLTRSFLQGHTVADAMLTNFQTLEHGASLDVAAQLLLSGSQHDFPVLSGDDVIGILPRNGIAKGLAQGGPSAYVAEFMIRDPKTAAPDLPLEMAVESLTSKDIAPILVMDGEKLIGMLTGENLSEFIMLEAARTQARKL